MHFLPARKLLFTLLAIPSVAAASVPLLRDAVESRAAHSAGTGAAAVVDALVAEGLEGASTAQFTGLQASEIAHSLYFARLQYGSGGRGGGWATDWPTADRTIISVLGRLTSADISPRENSVRLDSDDLRRFPFIYAVEVGGMNLRDNEVEALRNYLLAGGFLVVDDFWGSQEWARFESQIRRVFPEHDIVEIPLDHPIFSTVYQVDEIVQVPVVDQGIRGGPTHERDGYVPYCLGIFDDKGRLMVVINWNTDLGDAWEHAEHPRYPLEYSTYAYRMGANFIFYAMTR